MTKGRTGVRAGEPEARREEARAHRIALVRKRDGRVVPFRPQKIADAVLKAMEAAGEPDPGFATEIAVIVELSLLEGLPAREVAPAGAQPAIPHIEAIQDLVECALMELGRPAVAKAYILHRDLRARMRSAVQVHRSDALRSPVRVREREGISSWSKGRIVAALMEEAELAREAAEAVAGAVERRVFASGLKRVTTGLIRELVSGELFERGWIRALSAARVVGLARHDVRRLLQGFPVGDGRIPELGSRGETAPGEGDRLHRTLAGELLTRYALESVLPEGPSELHRSGDIHVVGLDQLTRPLSLCVEAELLAGGGEPSRSAYSVLDGVARLAPSVARTLVLEHPGAVLSPLARATREHSPHGLSAWLQALAALAQASGTRVDLGGSGPRFGAFTARLVEELGELPDGPFAPVLQLEGGELEALLREREDLGFLVDRLLARGRLWPAWNGEEELHAGPGCVRRRNEPGVIACGAAVALNLPRLARRAGAFREELFQGGLAELAQAAVEIARALRASLAEALPRPGGLHARTSFAIVPVGLREALLVLGDGTIDPEQGASILGVLGEAARRFNREDLVEAVPCPFFGGQAALRFACLDARSARAEGARQDWLFDEAGAEAELRAYGSGFRLWPAGGQAPGRPEAEALRTVPAGALSFEDLALPGDGGEELPHLDAWRRFEVLRRAHAGEIAVELFPRRRPLEAQAGSPRHSPLRPLV